MMCCVKKCLMKKITNLICALLITNTCFAGVIHTCGVVYQADCNGKVVGLLELTRLSATDKIPTPWFEIRPRGLPDTLWRNNDNERCLSYDPVAYPYLKFDYVGFKPVYLTQQDLDRNHGTFSVVMKPRKDLSCNR